MIENGRVCMKTAGSESGRFCVILERVDETNVLIDGEVSRANCNIKHLEFLPFVIDVKKEDTTEKILKKMIEANIIPEIHDKRDKSNKGPKPQKPLKKEKPKKEKLKKKPKEEKKPKEPKKDKKKEESNESKQTEIKE